MTKGYLPLEMTFIEIQPITIHKGETMLNKLTNIFFCTIKVFLHLFASQSMNNMNDVLTGVTMIKLFGNNEVKRVQTVRFEKAKKQKPL